MDPWSTHDVHERELVTEALETIRRLFGASSIDQIQIAVGPGVDVVAAAGAWTAITAGTDLADVHVSWEEAFDLLRCDACGHEFQGAPLDSCPYCGGDATVIEPALPISLGSWEHVSEVAP